MLLGVSSGSLYCCRRPRRVHSCRCLRWRRSPRCCCRRRFCGPFEREIRLFAARRLCRRGEAWRSLSRVVIIQCPSCRPFRSSSALGRTLESFSTSQCVVRWALRTSKITTASLTSSDRKRKIAQTRTLHARPQNTHPSLSTRHPQHSPQITHTSQHTPPRVL